MQKLGRNYSLEITGTNFPSTLIVSLPFTVEFDITRNTLTSANVCQIRLYNLSPQNRNALRKNVTSYGNAVPIINLKFKAGYGTNLPVVFSGNASQAWSVREGINFVTQLECFDGGFAYVNGQSNLTVPAGTSYRDVIINLIGDLFPSVQLGAVGNYPGKTPKQITFSGKTTDILDQLTGGGFFIDNGIGYALNNNEYALFSGPPATINASTGLLNTPVLEQTTVRFDMIFEPLLNIGTGINLQSANIQETIQPNFNGFYKIVAVKHRGMISETVCGDAITTGEFFFLANPTAVANGN